MKKPKKLSKYKKRQIIDMYLWGNTTGEIRRHTGESSALIRKTLREAKLIEEKNETNPKQ